jgi:hypothetical protein
MVRNGLGVDASVMPHFWRYNITSANGVCWAFVVRGNLTVSCMDENKEVAVKWSSNSARQCGKSNALGLIIDGIEGVLVMMSMKMVNGALQPYPCWTSGTRWVRPDKVWLVMEAGGNLVFMGQEGTNQTSIWSSGTVLSSKALNAADPDKQPSIEFDSLSDPVPSYRPRFGQLRRARRKGPAAYNYSSPPTLAPEGGASETPSMSNPCSSVCETTGSVKQIKACVLLSGVCAAMKMFGITLQTAPNPDNEEQIIGQFGWGSILLPFTSVPLSDSSNLGVQLDLGKGSCVTLAKILSSLGSVSALNNSGLASVKFCYMGVAFVASPFTVRFSGLHHVCVCVCMCLCAFVCQCVDFGYDHEDVR